MYRFRFLTTKDKISCSEIKKKKIISNYIYIDFFTALVSCINYIFASNLYLTIVTIHRILYDCRVDFVLIKTLALCIFSVKN